MSLILPKEYLVKKLQVSKVKHGSTECLAVSLGIKNYNFLAGMNEE